MKEARKRSWKYYIHKLFTFSLFGLLYYTEKEKEEELAGFVRVKSSSISISKILSETESSAELLESWVRLS